MIAERTVKPTRERMQHGRIERAERTQDAAGDVGLPWQALPLLVQWERAGVITPQMRIAHAGVLKSAQAFLEFLNRFDLGVDSARTISHIPSIIAPAAHAKCVPVRLESELING